ncbi:MFS transporter [Hymenobacter negativus]|uniref:MFS transporter n=1 Tax=Hymenobacter negativus TaxID=2795026 RepID=A0ABS3QJP4_9BACT|nr:MFS transporter [Hymenobacter negativus]MBO2011316.1 MFS transporter [Hymenobacter negativus]
MAKLLLHTPLQRWQLRTAAGLFVGYSAYYLCRSNLAVAAPLLIREFGSQGLNKEVMGQIASVGVLFYAAGKVVNGVLGDFLGGKKIFLLGMVGAVAATVAFGLGQGVAVFFVAWALNRLVQAMGWAGLVKITAHWFSYRSYGKIMGLLSLSYLVGDIAAKLLLGQLLVLGMGWRGLFGVAAAILALVALANWFTLASTPASVGLTAPPSNPDSLFEAGLAAKQPASLGALLGPYFRSPAFLLLLVLSFGLTALREAFSFWVPTYLVEAAHLSESAASQYSALYSAFGMLSILGAGYLSDTWLRGQRGPLLLAACLGLVPVLVLMAQPTSGGLLPLVLISLVGLLLLGPYSFLAGAMALDAGGRQGAATAAGLVDAVGYVGGTGALWLTGRLAEHQGWSGAFLALAALAAATAVAALVFYSTQERPLRPSAANVAAVVVDLYEKPGYN